LRCGRLVALDFKLIVHLSLTFSNGKRMREIRMKRGLAQQAVAERAGTVTPPEVIYPQTDQI
jgi:hypothetical protein